MTDSYWNRPDLNRQCFVDGWLLTGDYGVMDGEGFLTVMGRKDDMITYGGRHFFPAEAEAELGSVEGVAQYVIAGVRDRSGIQDLVPTAFVVPVCRQSWSPQRFLAAARQRLPGYMVPRRAIAVPSLPVTASGKVDRLKTVKIYTGSARDSIDGQV